MLSLDVKKRNESYFSTKEIVAFHVSAPDSFRRFLKWGQHDRPDIPCGNDVCIHFSLVQFFNFFFIC